MTRDSIHRYLNDDIAQTCNSNPHKFIGLCTVPLQDPILAVGELRRCVLELGMAGVQIGSCVNEWNLDERELDVFWEVSLKGIERSENGNLSSEARMRIYRA